jgi:hypothetical protein
VLSFYAALQPQQPTHLLRQETTCFLPTDLKSQVSGAGSEEITVGFVSAMDILPKSFRLLANSQRPVRIAIA